ncbi:MAG: pyruvate:ferredoxin (flavodoxin) oxidoreductase [Candidatus Hinthialibacter antarcticus]|nr:pyruvate:ferredoxin (flavodoxin) oxidoreductase [Candidatus Hinthialibacter antarcticus]
MARRMVTLDGNQAAAHVAHKTNEVCAIYPITPSSPMGEFSDQWSSEGKTNIWGVVPDVVALQSEGGASGSVHGALQAGALTTTFTASQGLLLMIPNMFKIAGELTSTVFHVTARSVACQALSIFGDHSDVMATRTTGFALLASNSIQEIMDFALISQAASLESRIPFVHFFDGFRSSHEVMKVEELTVDDMKAMICDDLVRAHRDRALSPDHPVIRGTAQNPDVYFQGRETVNTFYNVCPDIVQKQMDKFAELTGRQYNLFDYVGAPDAENVIMLMGSGAEAAHEMVEHMNANGEKVGVLKVRLYRPFSMKHFVNALPKSVKNIAVLDRTKEPGAGGEPLYLDVVNALYEAVNDGVAPFSAIPKVICGRYGLSSKEFTPAMIKAVFENLASAKPKNHFTIGIIDDVTHTSLDFDPTFSIESNEVVRGMFYGLGSDGTVGANKNSIKIIGEGTDNYAQGYFVYDSKKAGSVTVSHLRFGSKPIRSTYLINSANFIGCHQFVFLEKYDVLASAAEGAVFLLNSSYGADEVWDKIPRRVQDHIVNKKLKFYVIDAYKVARESRMGVRINTIMQTCFFKISGVLPPDEAIQAIKDAIQKSYGAKGEEIVKMNNNAVDHSVSNLYEVKVPATATGTIAIPPVVSPDAPKFVQEVIAPIIAGKGDEVPVSLMPVDGTFPLSTTRWEKRNIALEIPVWDEAVCIQCAKCSMACPHAAIRVKIYDGASVNGKPPTFKMDDARGKEFEGMKFTLQVAPEDCTGCGACVHICPAKNKQEPSKKAINMVDQVPLRESERENWDYFLGLPDIDRTKLKLNTIKGSQLCEPLFEFSGACSGCGETPYVLLMTQLFGDRALVANATGCSSIYGGNLPTTPYAANKDGRGPAWSNSLFEDNAEFGFGYRLAIDQNNRFAKVLLERLAPQIGDQLVQEILNADQSDEAGLAAQRDRVAALKSKLGGGDSNDAKHLLNIADYLVKKSVWIVGGDGWAYDIGYGGLDHVLASGRNVNVLVLDTEVYSNTGGQMSKATPMGAVAKFAAAGRPMGKKDMGMIAMSYGNIYVAHVAMGANDLQTVKAFIEAEAYDGPSLILAYSHCIAHGINMRTGNDTQKQAVDSGHWPLYRYNPDLIKENKNPLQLDSRDPKISFQDFAYNQTRFKMLTKSKPERARELLKKAQEDVTSRWSLYRQMADMKYGQSDE